MRFPVISFKSGMMFPATDEEVLTTCTKTALAKGYFENLRIIDSDGKKYKVKSAKKLQSVGPFWGYNIFLNQRIRVELSFHDKIVQLNIDDVRSMVLNALNGPQLWNASNDVLDIKMEVSTAASVYEIINAINQAYSRQ